jgi:hypothetical protein
MLMMTASMLTHRLVSYCTAIMSKQGDFAKTEGLADNQTGVWRGYHAKKDDFARLAERPRPSSKMIHGLVEEPKAGGQHSFTEILGGLFGTPEDSVEVSCIPFCVLQ